MYFIKCKDCICWDLNTVFENENSGLFADCRLLPPKLLSLKYEIGTYNRTNENHGCFSGKLKTS